MKKIAIIICALLTASFTYAQHTMVLKSGEKMNGKIESLSNGMINFTFKGNVMKFRVDEVSVIVFQETTDKMPDESPASKEKVVGEKSVIAGTYSIRYKVADRNIVTPPHVVNLTQKKGTVMVQVSIDKYGNVVKAVSGGEGSTTSDQYLFTKAQQAAESTKFDKVANAPLKQEGYMIVIF
jgi:hypothetical protein